MPILGALVVAVCLSCMDDGPVGPAAVVESPEPTPRVAAVLGQITCAVQVGSREVSCRHPADSARSGVSPAAVLGQGEVKLTSTNVQYDTLTEIFSFDVTLQNLLAEPIGTPDGTTASGSKVVYVEGPTVTSYVQPGDTGTVTVDNPDGYANVYAENQPYHFHAGILEPGEVSDTVHWRLAVPREVNTFSFTVLVVTPTPSDQSVFPRPPFNSITPDDSLHVIQSQTDTAWVYYRRYVGIVFQESAADEDKGDVIWSRDGRIVGGSTGSDMYLVEFPDPGPTWEAYSEFMDSLDAEPAVDLVIPRVRSGPKGEVHFLFPSDSERQQRDHWIDSAQSISPFLAIRAPLAWGCETGMYSDDRVRVGVLEWDFLSNSQDLATSAPTIIDARDPIGPIMGLAQADSLRFHGNAMSGLISAEGDNDYGVAGMMWRTELRQYLLGGPKRGGRAAELFVEQLRLKIAEDEPRVLSISINFATAPDWAAYESLVRGLRTMLTESPRTVVLKSVGNSGRQDRTQPWATETGTLIGALSELKRTGFADRILFVAGTDQGNTLWEHSDFILGETDIAAPAYTIDVLGLPSSVVPGLQGEVVTVTGGTSSATALVAGVAAQLVSMDSTLTAAQLKQIILDGAEVDQSPVAGAPEPIHQLDAYGALKLAARRPGAPLCGSRLWARNGQAEVDRDGGFDPIFSIGESAGDLYALHGGRQVLLLGGDSRDRRVFLFESGVWTEGPDPGPFRDSVPGGTNLSMWKLSHDVDSIATVDRRWESFIVSFIVSVEDAAGTKTVLDTISVPEPPGTAEIHCGFRDWNVDLKGWECERVDSLSTGGETVFARLAYPPMNDKIIVIINRRRRDLVQISDWHHCEWADPEYSAECRTYFFENAPVDASVYSVDIRGSANTALLATIPARTIYWLGIAESGDEFVTGGGQEISSSIVEWWKNDIGSLFRRTVTAVRLT